MIIVKREAVEAASERAIAAFTREFGRAPTRQEFAMILGAILRHLDDADSRLH